jgi:hypothetical protein
MGDPLATGSSHDIVTSSFEFAVVTVSGGSAINAHSKVKVELKVL